MFLEEHVNLSFVLKYGFALPQVMDPVKARILNLWWQGAIRLFLGRLQVARDIEDRMKRADDATNSRWTNSNQVSKRYDGERLCQQDEGPNDIPEPGYDVISLSAGHARTKFPGYESLKNCGICGSKLLIRSLCWKHQILVSSSAGFKGAISSNNRQTVAAK
ncbi:unnamed protein product [Clonostachys rhizophaga]|uniref:Uncharacterized protein n=1 Tax=Clonostachys rhizophaga TaxID=160324 RepID=A0A9N9VQH0_9HYPO|nr:unnamed protein product [Clonostachys rhizophaga]